MTSFWELIQKIHEDAAMPPPAPPGGAAPPLPGGGALPGMGGGMGAPMGGGGGMGGMGGGMGGGAPAGGAPAPSIQIKPSTVWEILEKILEGKPIDKPEKKPTGQPPDDMLQGNQPSQPSQPDPTAAPPPQQGMAPSGQPPTQPPAMPTL